MIAKALNYILTDIKQLQNLVRYPRPILYYAKTMVT